MIAIANRRAMAKDIICPIDISAPGMPGGGTMVTVWPLVPGMPSCASRWVWLFIIKYYLLIIFRLQYLSAETRQMQDIHADEAKNRKRQEYEN